MKAAFVDKILKFIYKYDKIYIWKQNILELKQLYLLLTIILYFVQSIDVRFS